MLQYAASRVLWLAPTLLAMALVTFLVMHATPGSPLDPVAEGANPLPPEAQKNLARAYGLDKPLYQQFLDLRRQGRPRRLRPVVRLQDANRQRDHRADVPRLALARDDGLRPGGRRGLALGILGAVHQNRGWDYVSVSLATFGVAVPNFVLAVFAIVLFSFVVPLFPTGGWDSPRNWVLPTITLSLAPMGLIARYTRASMLEVIRSDFTLTARSKGLAERR